MSDYRAYENQTLYDVAAHVYGNTVNVVELALLNNISIDVILTAGQNVKLVDAPVNTLVKKSLESRAIIPSSGFINGELQGELLPPIGIGTMIIENNFEVA